MIKKAEQEIAQLISLGVEPEFAKMLPKKARRQILDGILGIQSNPADINTSERI